MGLDSIAAAGMSESEPAAGWRSCTGSPLSICREDVVLCLHDGVTLESAIGPAAERLERFGREVVVELGVSPSAGVRKSLAVTMKSMSCRVSGTVVGAGASALCFAFQWILAILEPSGNGLPLPGAPAR